MLPLGGESVSLSVPCPDGGEASVTGEIISVQEFSLIVDFAGCFDGYLVDQTRVFALGGLPDKLRKGYDDMLKVQSRMLISPPARGRPM